MKAIATVLLLFASFVLLTGCPSEQSIDFQRYYSAGSLVYQQHCQNCHGSSGEGLSALIPPLTDSSYLRKNMSQLPCYVQNGVSAPLIVYKKIYDNKMRPSGLSPVEIAEVLTYINNSFGNKLGVFDTETVQKNLKNCQ